MILANKALSPKHIVESTLFVTGLTIVKSNVIILSQAYMGLVFTKESFSSTFLDFSTIDYAMKEVLLAVMIFILKNREFN